LYVLPRQNVPPKEERIIAYSPDFKNGQYYSGLKHIQRSIICLGKTFPPRKTALYLIAEISKVEHTLEELNPYKVSYA